MVLWLGIKFAGLGGKYINEKCNTEHKRQWIDVNIIEKIIGNVRGFEVEF